MAIGISKIAGVHEAVVFDGIDIDRAAIRSGWAYHCIHNLAAVARQSEHHFARRLWWDGAAREGAPFGTGEQHEIDGFTPDHASSGLPVN
jgi:hypothetical protein